MAAGWTIDTLKAYFERVIADQDRRVELALNAAQTAINKAETAQERRLDLLNEFRAQAVDEQKRFLPRETFETTVAQWVEWRASVDKQLSGQSGRQQGAQALTGNAVAFVAVVAGVAAVLGHFIH